MPAPPTRTINPSQVLPVQIVPNPPPVGTGPLASSQVTQAGPVSLSPTDHVYHALIIQASPNNTDKVYVGSQGNQSYYLPPAASVTLYDVAPNWVFVSSPTLGQTVTFLGSGYHQVTEGAP